MPRTSASQRRPRTLAALHLQACLSDARAPACRDPRDPPSRVIPPPMPRCAAEDVRSRSCGRLVKRIRKRHACYGLPSVRSPLRESRARRRPAPADHLGPRSKDSSIPTDTPHASRAWWSPYESRWRPRRRYDRAWNHRRLPRRFRASSRRIEARKGSQWGRRTRRYRATGPAHERSLWRPSRRQPLVVPPRPRAGSVGSTTRDIPR
jgi:hypothetical protein